MASKSFHKLIAHPKITKGIAQLTNATELRIWHDQIQNKPPEIGGTIHWYQDTIHWYQDTPLWPIIAPITEGSNRLGSTR